jgi:hypothetical protein
MTITDIWRVPHRYSRQRRHRQLNRNPAFLNHFMHRLLYLYNTRYNVVFEVCRLVLAHISNDRTTPSAGPDKIKAKPWLSDMGPGAILNARTYRGLAALAIAGYGRLKTQRKAIPAPIQLREPLAVPGAPCSKPCATGVRWTDR